MKTETNKIDLFEKLPIPIAVATLSIPTVLSSLVMVLYNLADTFFVGMLQNPIQTASITLVAPVMLAFNAVNNLFGVGTSSTMSRALGSKDYKTVTNSSVFGIYCSVFFGIIFSVSCIVFNTQLLNLLGADNITIEATKSYMKWTVLFGAVPSILNVVLAYLIRAEGASLHASIGTMSGCFLNIILDPFFILPQFLNLGAQGAGLATFISNCFACSYFIILILTKKEKTFVCLNIKRFKFEKPIIKDIFNVGIPASIQNILNVTGMTILNNFTSPYGADAVASMGISQKLIMIPLMIMLGSAQGIMPLVGYCYASRNFKRMKMSVYFSVAIIFPFIVLTTIAYFIFSKNLISLFMNTPQIILYGSFFIKAGCLTLPFLSLDFLAVGVFQAVGKGNLSFLFAILRKILLEIPALFLLNNFIGLYGLPFAQPIAEFILAIASVIILQKVFFSKTYTT